MASELLVNKITPESGNTLTLGESGDTISFASGVLPSLESLTITGDLTVDTNTFFVDSTNNLVGIGTTSPSAKLEVEGGTDLIDLTNTGVGTYRLAISGTDRFSIFDVGASTERISIDSSGNVGIGTTSPSQALDVVGSIEVSDSIYLGGTGSANALDDYEEGSFTPAIIGTTTAGTGTYSVQDGDYTKIGQLVRVAVHLRWSAHTGSGNMEIGELPFTSGLGGTRYNIPSFFTYNITLGTNKVITGFNPGNSTRIRLQAIATGGGTTANLGMDASGEVYATLVYRI